MDLISIISGAAGAAALVAGTTAAVIACKAVKRARNARRFALESVELVNSLLGAGTRVIAAGQIPADSAAGRELLAMLEAGCECPRHAAARAERDGE